MVEQARAIEGVIRAAAVMFEIASDELQAHMDLVEDLGADSIDLAEFVLYLQEEFQITLPNPTPAVLMTLGSVAQWVDGFLPTLDIASDLCPQSLNA